MRELLERYPGAGLLGFSQGAALAATLAALSARKELPPVPFVVLVAGGIPRAGALRPLFDRPVAVPSLHVWGERDVLAVTRSAALAECFDPDARTTFVWSGSHVLPTRGPGGDALVAYIGSRARHGTSSRESSQR
jgi:predicted esterase